MVFHATSNGCCSWTTSLLTAPSFRRDARLPRKRSAALLLLRSERSELLAPECCARNSPAALGCLRQQHPGSARLARVTRDPRDDLRRFGDELLLALPRQHTRGRENLDADRARTALRCRVDCGRRKAMDVRAGVVRVRGP